MSSALSSPFLTHHNSLPAPTLNTWATLWAVFLSLTWLFPNHYLPWTAFHSEAWVALISGMAVIPFLLLSKAPVLCPRIALLVLGLMLVPAFQFALGLLPFAGQAWIVAAYMLGLFLAILCGMRWEKERPGEMPAALFLAIGIACIFSVGLQLYQWLHLDGLEIYSMGINGARPYGNLGQPNQLGSLLLLGLLACAWGVNKKKISPLPAMLMAGFLLFGIALTQSRTAWLGILLLLIMSWIWRKHWHSQKIPWAITYLSVGFMAISFAIPWISESLYLQDVQIREIKLGQDNPRIAAWSLFADAILQRPWTGYGWAPLGHAQLAVATVHPPLEMTFQHAHNLFLDLMLWCGVPLGLSASLLILWWLISVIKRVGSIDNAILVAFILVLGNHSMLEFPLYYAYFLCRRDL
jgi:O-antigen ligase